MEILIFLSSLDRLTKFSHAQTLKQASQVTCMTYQSLSCDGAVRSFTACQAFKWTGMPQNDNLVQPHGSFLGNA